MNNSIKKIAKFFLISAERKKVFREYKIKKEQDISIKEINHDTEKLIIFFLDGANYDNGKENISGGLLSIHSIYEETLKLKALHKAEVILCTIKSVNLFFKFTSFSSSAKIYRYEQLEHAFPKVTEVIVHLPEYLTSHFLYQIKFDNLRFFKRPLKFHLNILNQNIQLMPDVEVISELKNYCSLMSQTTAHKKYANINIREKYKIPLHHFSTFISPEKYEFVNFQNKKDIICFSPDDKPLNNIFISLIKDLLPKYEIQVIDKMTYEAFKQLIGYAKFTFTFGEGLDGYYCESVLSGGICFAIYNEDFFTPEYEQIETVYKSIQSLQTNIIDHIKKLDNESLYDICNKSQFALLTSQYNFKEYQDNIKQFYLNNYTFK